MNKKEIRKNIKSLRNSMAEEDIGRKSLQILKKLLETGLLSKYSRIYTYVSAKNEVDTLMLMDYCFKNELQVFVPKVIGDSMEFYEITDITELSPGYFGIFEPATDAKEPDYTRKGLFIMPGVAFDKELNRIGYGGGFYDRYLDESNRFYKVALAYDFQIVDNIPSESTDIRPDMLITESGIYK